MTGPCRRPPRRGDEHDEDDADGEDDGDDSDGVNDVDDEGDEDDDKGNHMRRPLRASGDGKLHCFGEHIRIIVHTGTSKENSHELLKQTLREALAYFVSLA